MSDFGFESGRDTETEVSEEVRELIRARNIFEAVNTAKAAIAKYEEDGEAPIDLRLLEVEALQKIRAAATANLRLHQLGLDQDFRADSPLSHRRDLLAARIQRDCALRTTTTVAEKKGELLNAAKAFIKMFNSRAEVTLLAGAATSFAYAGHLDEARRCAEGVLRILERQGDAEDDVHAKFVRLSIKASAHTILTQPGEEPIDAQSVVSSLLDTWEKSPAAGGHEHDRARVLQRLRFLCEAVGISDSFLDIARNLKVLHFVGHPFNPNSSFDRRKEAERILETKIKSQIARLHQKPVAAFGSLAAGPEIMMAEALLEAGADLHIQIPCLQEDFIDHMVAPMGGDWVVRYFACINHKNCKRVDVTNPCHSAVERIGDDLRLTAEVAMGRTLLHAQRLEADAAQIAVVPEERLGHWGPAEARSFWLERELGGDYEIPLGAPVFELNPNAKKPMAPVAILFSDVSGFSRLNNDDLETYSGEFLSILAAAYKQASGEKHLHLNTWGDAIFAVFHDVEVAAQVALALQEATAEYCRAQDEDSPLSKLMMRIALHHGPALPADDPFLGKSNFFGAAITLGARVEPVTTAGAVMMTESFAAKLALTKGEDWLIDFVGETKLPKKYGMTALYLLSSRNEAPKLPVSIGKSAKKEAASTP